MDNKPSDYAIAKAFWEINHKDGWDSSPNALSLKCAVIERAKEIDVTEQPHGASVGSDAPYFVEVDQNGCASCGHDRMWTVVGPDGVAASKSWGDEEEAEWFCECMNEAFAVGQANPPAAITAKPGKGETK